MAAPEHRFASDDSNGPLPFGLTSLADMINFQIFGFATFLEWLTMERKEAQNNAVVVRIADVGDRAGFPMEGVRTRLNEHDIKRVTGMLTYGQRECKRLGLEASDYRIDLIFQKLRVPPSFADYGALLNTLDETISGELRFLYFYHYPKRQAEAVLQFQPTWEPVIAKFRSCEEDARAAVDCWALGHGTASVFHSMRVAEKGLHALARERRVALPKGRPLEYGEWGAVIDGLATKALELANKPARYGQKREAAVSFYRGCIGELEAFRDVYRNPVSHTRRRFDAPQAESVLSHVRGFMTRLSEKLGEDDRRQIAWGIR